MNLLARCLLLVMLMMPLTLHASAQERSVPSPVVPAYTTIVDVGEFQSILLENPQHVSIDENCAQRNLTRSTHSRANISGTLYGYLLPALSLGFTSGDMDSAGYLVMTGVDDHSDETALTHLWKIKAALRGQDVDFTFFTGVPLLNTFITGAFVSNKVWVDITDTSGIGIVYADGHVVTVDQGMVAITPVQRLSTSTFTGAITTTIAGNCVRSVDSVSVSEFPVSGRPVAIVWYNDTNRITNTKGNRAVGEYVSTLVEVRIRTGQLKRMMADPSASPASIAQVATEILGVLKRLDGLYDVPAMPNEAPYVASVESVATMSRQIARFYSAYKLLRAASDLSDLSDARRQLTDANAALSLFRGLEAVGNSQQMVAYAQTLAKSAALHVATLESQERASAARRVREETQTAKLRASAQHRRAVAAQEEAFRESAIRRQAALNSAATYKRDQRRLILSYGRVPDLIDSVVEEGRSYERWRWGSDIYIFAPGGSLVRGPH